MTRVDGEVARGFEPVGDAFRQVLAEQTGTGAAMAAWHDGRWVARLYGGYTDASHTRPWRPDSIVMPYSVTKPSGRFLGGGRSSRILTASGG